MVGKVSTQMPSFNQYSKLYMISVHLYFELVISAVVHKILILLDDKLCPSENGQFPTFLEYNFE